MSYYLNTGLLFNKHYFKDINFGGNYKENTENEHLLKANNELLFKTPLNKTFAGFETQQIKLTTIYPGLLLGSGYAHESLILGELKLGFFFDYTTGMPVLPGSSVKGVIRNAFEKATEIIEVDKKKVAAGKYVQELLKEISKNEWELEDVYRLERAIFEKDEHVSVYKRDIFFDAHPIVSGNKGSAFLDNDYITHHENPLKNPDPVQFLKILPNVQFQFNFRLTDNGSLSADNKLKLFKQILLDLGIGTKTNVGYGQFVDREPVFGITSGETNNAGSEIENSEHPSQIGTTIDSITKYTKIEGEYLKGEKYKAKILIEENGYFIIGIEDDRFVKSIENIERKFKQYAAKRIKKGQNGIYKKLKVKDEITIRINDDTGHNFTVLPIWID